MKNIAVVLAGGLGLRLGGALPKQLLPMDDGRSVLAHTIAQFEASPHIAEICVVAHADYIESMRREVEMADFTKVRAIIPGGAERWQSSMAAIDFYCNQLNDNELHSVNLLLHDAARPFVTAEIIENVCIALEQHQAVTVAVPSVDTVYEVANGCLVRIPARATILRAQTPQAFRLPLIREAYARAASASDFFATDDCGVVHQFVPNVSIFVVSGDECNRKITFKTDL